MENNGRSNFGGYDGGGQNLGAWYGLVIQQAERISRQEEALRSCRNKIENLERRANELDSKAKEAVEQADKLKTDVRNVRNKTLEPLAVFVGLFTFVSVGFNILSGVKDIAACYSLLMLLAGGLVIFAALVVHVGSLESDDKTRRYWTAGLLAVGVILGAIGAVMYLGYVNSEASVDSRVEQILEEVRQQN